MTTTTKPAEPVLDASALLALMLRESGWPDVATAISEGAVIGAANLAEVLTRLAEDGTTARAWLVEVRRVTDEAIKVEPLIEEDAVQAAELRRRSRQLGLSLGDRACLAVASRLGAPVLTADRAWVEVPGLGVAITLIR